MRYADFYGNNELRQAAFSYASLLGGRFISKDEHLVYMDAAGRSYVPPAANTANQTAGNPCPLIL